MPRKLGLVGDSSQVVPTDPPFVAAHRRAGRRCRTAATRWPGGRRRVRARASTVLMAERYPAATFSRSDYHDGSVAQPASVRQRPGGRPGELRGRLRADVRSGTGYALVTTFDCPARHPGRAVSRQPRPARSGRLGPEPRPRHVRPRGERRSRGNVSWVEATPRRRAPTTGPDAACA
jgi:hypothetical protein